MGAWSLSGPCDSPDSGNSGMEAHNHCWDRGKSRVLGDRYWVVVG